LLSVTAQLDRSTQVHLNVRGASCWQQEAKHRVLKLQCSNSGAADIPEITQTVADVGESNRWVKGQLV